MSHLAPPSPPPFLCLLAPCSVLLCAAMLSHGGWLVAVQVGARQSVINVCWLERKVDFSAALAVAVLPLPSARARSLQPPRSDRWRELKKGIKHWVLLALGLCQGDYIKFMPRSRKAWMVTTNHRSSGYSLDLQVDLYKRGTTGHNSLRKEMYCNMNVVVILRNRITRRNWIFQETKS